MLTKNYMKVTTTGSVLILKRGPLHPALQSRPKDQEARSTLELIYCSIDSIILLGDFVYFEKHALVLQFNCKVPERFRVGLHLITERRILSTVFSNLC